MLVPQHVNADGAEDGRPLRVVVDVQEGGTQLDQARGDGEQVGGYGGVQSRLAVVVNELEVGPLLSQEVQRIDCVGVEEETAAAAVAKGAQVGAGGG